MDYDPTMQVGTDPTSRLSAHPWFHSSYSRVEKLIEKLGAWLLKPWRMHLILLALKVYCMRNEDMTAHLQSFNGSFQSYSGVN